MVVHGPWLTCASRAHTAVDGLAIGSVAEATTLHGGSEYNAATALVVSATHVAVGFGDGTLVLLPAEGGGEAIPVAAETAAAVSAINLAADGALWVTSEDGCLRPITARCATSLSWGGGGGGSLSARCAPHA